MAVEAGKEGLLWGLRRVCGRALGKLGWKIAGGGMVRGVGLGNGWMML